MAVKPDIRQASLTDLSNVQSVMREAAPWLIDKGEPLWSPLQFSEDKLKILLAQNLLYLASIYQKAFDVVRYEMAVAQ